MNEDKIKEAGQKALAFREEGFHCSESVFLAINETLLITDPALVCMMTGFHGGGGTHRTQPGVDLTGLLADLSAGREKRPISELPITQVGHLCGVVAAGIVCFGLLYGRQTPADDLTCVDELSFELHRRFRAEFGSSECHALRRESLPRLGLSGCELIYRRGAELAVELILQANELIPECRE